MDINQFGIKLSVKHLGFRDHFKEGKLRHTYRCRLSRGRKSYSFDFGQSLAAGEKEPTLYDVLTCLTKTDPEDYMYFCDCYGYDWEEKDSKRIYRRVLKEWEAMNRLFTQYELELLQEIQ